MFMKSLLVLVITLMSSVSMAAYPYAGVVPQGYAPTVSSAGPQQILRRGIEKISKFRMPQGPKGLAHAFAFMETEISPRFDFSRLTQSAAGPMYRRLTSTQRATLESKVKADFLETLTGNLSQYNSRQIQYFPARRVGRNQASVSIRLRPHRGRPMRLDFRFSRHTGKWKIHDVSVNGSSAVNYYRGYISRSMRQKGRAWLDN
ncbi:MAG TPA: ABC transporter substrate-binding protein [Chromatiaceae bacterium]|nr:ABC transporter substrate-binding protein [Chromatiaceae bacterium]